MQTRRPLALLLVACAALLEPAAASLTNQLADHPSPYLAMHGQDPVHWQTWGTAAQEAAVRQNKLLYVSSGYFSCHWCHVMQRESYANPEIARILNEHFIPVKVDRELNPALDSRLIDFVERTRGHAGWPLNVFITPGGYPLIGMVYLPPDDFKALLQKLAREWQTNREALNQLAADAGAELAAMQTEPAATLEGDAAREYARLLVTQALQLADELQGGFGQQNKFPSVPQLRVLLHLQQRWPQPSLDDFLRLTLDQMASQGLNDHLGGGFFRYTVDPAWQIPHFEKMLYDNAQLARLYLEAAAILDHAPYREVAFRTLDFLLRELATPQGAFAASLSAVDDRGVEGGYYLWTGAELRQILNEAEWPVARAAWGLDSSPELEAGHHLVQYQPLREVARQLGLSLPEAEARLASARAKLLVRRQQRRVPVDTKPIAAWNGLALSALAAAVGTEGGERYRQAGRRLRDYLVTVSWRDGRLRRVASGGEGLGRAGLEDYAYVATGLLDWAAVSGTPRDDMGVARAIAASAWQRFYPAFRWRLAEDMWLRYGAGGQVVLPDGVLPSPSAILIDTSLRLARQSGDRKQAEQAETALRRGETELSEAPFWHASQIGALGWLTRQKSGRR